MTPLPLVDFLRYVRLQFLQTKDWPAARWIA